MSGDTSSAGRAAGRGRLPSLLHWPDLRITLIILAVCAALYYVTTTFDSVPEFLNQNIPATWFPRLMIWTIALLSLLLPLEHLFSEAGKEGLDEDRKVRIEPIAWWTALLLIGITAMIPLLGTSLTMMVACVALPLLWLRRLSWKIGVFAVVFPLVVTLLFTQVLKVYFEPGLWRGWFH